MVDPLDEHYGYLADSIKRERYRVAIEQAVRPEHLVMDLGCGSGLLGLMALRAGASEVLFVEEGAIIEVARRAVTDAGFADKARFLHANSYELSLSEPVDVVLCDHVGYFGFDYGILGLLADARARFLKPGGTLIPTRIDLKLAPVETNTGREFVSRWRDGSVPDDFAWIAGPAANSKRGVNLDAANLLAEPASIATLAAEARSAPFYSWQTTMRFTRDGTFDGLLGWFDCLLHGDVRMTNSPMADDGLQRPQAFLPLPEPVMARHGEEIVASIMARPVDHIIAWTVELPAQGKRLSLTTFNGLLLDDEALKRSRPDRLVQLNDRGRARQVILSYCDGTRTAGEIEALVNKEHPDLFPSDQAAEKLIRSVLAWDTGE